MKTKKISSIMYIYLIPAILILGIIVISAVTTFYTTTTVDGNGRVVKTTWAKSFTREIASHISDTEGSISISDEALKLLHDNNLWLQVIDENGDEIESYYKPADIQSHYSPYDLVIAYQAGTDDYTVFMGQIKDSNNTYIVGFPIKISKVVTYVDTKRYNSSKPLIIATMIITFLIIVASGVLYSFIISRMIKKIKLSLNQVASRSYLPVKRRMFLHEIYDGIDKLDQDILAADKIREKNEKSREEWIANITHDLKTPLAPIKGYAEILSNKDNIASIEKYHEYGAIIGKNAGYAEQLINDLKLTYQLKNDMLPINKKKQNISRFIKEMIIDILNNPDFADRSIDYFTSDDSIECSFDFHLLKRAINNIIINSIIHNDDSVQINVSVILDNDIIIKICDNGKGMSKDEVESLFERYYRGTSTKERPEGTGLGMAIAKQIVELHNGTINVESKINCGTSIIVKLPNTN